MSAELDISSQVDRSEITIGDRIHYEIKAVYPKQGRLELPSVLGNLGAFEVKDYSASEPEEAGEARIQTWRFDLSTFTVGKYTIPPQLIEYREGNDTAARAFYTQPIEIEVKRTSAETVKDIADIAPLVPVEAPVPWLLYGLGGALALAAALLIWRMLRGKRSGAAPEKPQLPPFEEAMEALGGLKDLALIRQNRAREFCFALSEILRRYLSRRYGIDALESTTSEFLEKARALPVTAAQKEWLAAFCEKTDLVKFANAPLLESEAGGLLGSVGDFLRQTRPREDEAGQAGRTPASGGPASAAGGAAAAEAGSGRGNAGSGQNPAPSGKTGPAKPVRPGSGAGSDSGSVRRPGSTPGGGLIQGGHGHDGEPKGGRPA